MRYGSGKEQTWGLNLVRSIRRGNEEAFWSFVPRQFSLMKVSRAGTLTVNTDFAQVEVDEVRTNLTRFPLFFPEKRPFFLENAGIFSAGRRRRWTCSSPVASASTHSASRCRSWGAGA